MKRLLLVALISVTFLLTSCSPTAIALLDAIVTSAEIVIPTIPNLSPADSQNITNYVDAALAITNDVLNNGTTPQGITQAIADFNRLVVPQLSGANPVASNLIAALAKAIQNFIAAYQASHNATVGAAKNKTITLNAKDQMKVQALKVRVQKARAQLGKR